MLIDYKNGQGSIVLRVKLRNSSVSTGAGLTGLTSASTGLIISTIADNESSATAYTVAGSTIETITTLGTYAAPTATKCRFKEVDSTNHKGIYEIQIADARFAVSSAKSLLVSISGATNLAECDVVVPLRSVDPYDAVRFGMTALPNAASGSAGAVITSGTGTAQLSTSSGQVLLQSGTGTGQLSFTSGVVQADAAKINGVATTNVTTVNANLGTTQPVNFTGTAASALVKSDVQDYLGSTAPALVGGRYDASVGAYQTGLTPLQPTVAGRTLDVSATGEAGVDWANVGSPTATLNLSGTTISTSQAVASVSGAVGSVTGNVGGNVTGSVGSVATGGITAASIADGAIDRATFAADTGLQTVRSNTAQAGGSTSITLDASASATTDYYINSLIYLTGGTGVGQARFCTAYNGTTKVATVNSAWATNPDATTTFAVIPFDSIPGATAPTAAQVATAVFTDLLSGSDFSTAGSFGKLVKDNLDATVSSRGTSTLTQTQVTGGAYALQTDASGYVKLSSGTGTGQVSLSSGAVTVGTNNDKTGYALTGAQSISSLAISGAFTVSGGVTFTGANASGSTPATAGLTVTGGAASTTSGGTAAPAIKATGGAGAASTNGAAEGALYTAGGTTTVSGADGFKVVGTGNGHGQYFAGAGNGEGWHALGGANAGGTLAEAQSGDGASNVGAGNGYGQSNYGSGTGAGILGFGGQTGTDAAGALFQGGNNTSPGLWVASGNTLSANPALIVDGTVSVAGTATLAALTATGTVTLGALTVSGATTLTGAVSATNASNDIRGVKLAATGLAGITAWTVDITGSLTGSVGSVTGAVGSVTGNVGGSVASVTGAVGSVTGNVGGNVAGSVASVTAAVTLTSAYDFAKGTVAMTEAYAANGVAPTPVQAIFAIHQYLQDFAISGTSYTVKKLDNATTAFVITLDDAATPTAASRT